MMLQEPRFEESVILNDNRGKAKNLPLIEYGDNEDRKNDEEYKMLGIRKEESNVFMTDSTMAALNGNGPIHYPSEKSVIGDNQGMNYKPVEYNYPVRGPSILNNERKEMKKNDFPIDVIQEEEMENASKNMYDPLRASGIVDPRFSNSMFWSLLDKKRVSMRVFLGACLINTKNAQTWLAGTTFDESKNIMDTKIFFLQNPFNKNIFLQNLNHQSFIITPSGKLYIHDFNKILLFEPDAKDECFVLKQEIPFETDLKESVLHLVYDESSKHEYLIVCGGKDKKNKPMGCVYVINLMTNFACEFFSLSHSKGKPIVFNDLEYLYILGGCKKRPKFCDRISLGQIFNIANQKIIIQSLKVKLMSSFITKSSFRGAAAIPTPKGIYLLGRKMKKTLKVQSIDSEKKIIYINYGEKKMINELELCNANVFYSDKTINYIYPNSLSPQEHEIGCLICE